MYNKCGVTEHKKLCDGFYFLKLKSGYIVQNSHPGQFVMVKVCEGTDPFLLRPFCINNIDKTTNTFDIIYKQAGRGTKLLSAVNAGESVEVLGPLGSGFPIGADMKRVALFGRGIGLAPMLFLAKKAAAMGIETYVFMSAGREEYLFNRQDYIELGAKVFTLTDDSRVITELFEQELKSVAFDAAYVCGSKRVMRRLYELSKIHGFKGYASLEEHMACGIGACKGCICETKNNDGSIEYSRVCKEGPVFPLERLM